MKKLLSKLQNKQFITYAVFGVALYFIVSGVSFGIFSLLGLNRGGATLSPLPSGTQGRFVVDKSAPKTEVCPLNGKYFTKQEKEIWEKRRPLAVMVENHMEARPQSGLSSADVVYEAVAEGGISRFMAVFYCGAAEPVTIAPVRSARTYYLPWVLEYDALYNHVGGAGRCEDPTVDTRAKALCQIEQYGIKDMDQFGISFPICYRNYDRLDHPVATEHTMVCFSDKLYKLAGERGLTNVDAKGAPWDKNFVSWKFKDDAKGEELGTATSISFSSWKGYEAEYGVRWDFDKAANSYKRVNGGKPHTDLENKEQLTAKSVVVLFAKETGPVDEHLHLLYGNIGSGEAIVFQDGKTVKGTWTKATKNARTKFFDTNGKEIVFNRGQLWIEMVPTGTPVTY